MLYSVSGIKIGFEQDQDDALERELARRGVGTDRVVSRRIVRRSLDSRRKNDIHFLYQLEIETEEALRNPKNGIVAVAPVPVVRRGSIASPGPVVVIGAGPAGLFAALALAEMGMNPTIIERGARVEQRTGDVDRFWSAGELDPDSNMQFGEGGAGTFSDGKLTTRIANPLMERVFRALVDAGAPGEILYDYKPHIGTDLLVHVVANLRAKIEALGGTFRFNTRLEDWVEKNGTITGLVLADGEQMPVGRLVLATGHSARDTYAMLHRRSVALAAKDFAVGSRIEHPQELINRMQYGSHWADPRLPTATYSFSHKAVSVGKTRGVFTFCMCPGGEVVSAASEAGGTLVNGMSTSRRDGRFANSAVVVTVGSADYGSGLLDGLAFQRRLEQDLFRASGGYGSTFQRLDDFRAGRPSRGAVESSFRMDLTPGDLAQTLPSFVTDALRSAFDGWGRAVSFVSPAAVLIGHETRTSSPLRILRNEKGISLSHSNLIPIGEGAGYAGGIISAAVDGLRTVESAFTEPTGEAASA